MLSAILARGLRAVMVVTAIASSAVSLNAAGAWQEQPDLPRYKVLSSKVEGHKREFTILMDAAYFVEAELRKLMKHFFEKYPQPESMCVYLTSHSSQISFFAVSGYGTNPEWWNRHAGGVFIREDGNEIIRYHTPGSDRITIVVKGSDPYSED